MAIVHNTTLRFQGKALLVLVSLTQARLYRSYGDKALQSVTWEPLCKQHIFTQDFLTQAFFLHPLHWTMMTWVSLGSFRSVFFTMVNYTRKEPLGYMP